MVECERCAVVVDVPETALCYLGVAYVIGGLTQRHVRAEGAFEYLRVWHRDEF